ncbi:MAG TPA: hypothetical protein VHK27_13340 [Gammaproteobacteria bacterium]|nr:hypothetical protein [Gammaproteobacteria bacterium]
MKMIIWLLAGFAVLENPNPIEFSSRVVRLLEHGQIARTSGDFVHSSDHSRVYHFRFVKQRPATLLIGSTAPWLEPDKVCSSAVLSSIIESTQTGFLNRSLRTALAE